MEAGALALVGGTNATNGSAEVAKFSQPLCFYSICFRLLIRLSDTDVIPRNEAMYRCGIRWMMSGRFFTNSAYLCSGVCICIDKNRCT